MKTVLCCEDSLEGIFSGIYEGWAGHYGHKTIELQLEENHNIEFFAQYIKVTTDQERAAKVQNTIRRTMGQVVFEAIARAALSYEKDKGTAIYHLVVRALSMECPGRVFEVLSDPWVLRVTKLSGNVWREAEHLLGFVRFEELDNGVLLSVIGPRNQVLPILAPHFENRLPLENWVIYDQNRQEFAIHPRQKHWILLRGECLEEDVRRRISENEQELQLLWKGFCRSIMIKDRENTELQTQMLPKRFQKYMTEFK